MSVSLDRREQDNTTKPHEPIRAARNTACVWLELRGPLVVTFHSLNCYGQLIYVSQTSIYENIVKLTLEFYILIIFSLI